MSPSPTVRIRRRMVRRPPARGATVTASTVRAPRAQRMTARSGGDITMSALLLLALALAITASTACSRASPGGFPPSA
ncbi:MAG: hypothetical protein WDM88_01405 [Galbitalea sp.]